MAFRGPIRYSLANFLLLEVDKRCSIMGKVLFGTGISRIVSLKETIEHNMQGLAKSGQQNTKWKKQSISLPALYYDICVYNPSQRCVGFLFFFKLLWNVFWIVPCKPCYIAKIFLTLVFPKKPLRLSFELFCSVLCCFPIILHP